MFVVHATVENVDIDSVSCKIAWFVTVAGVNHATLHDAESKLTFSTVYMPLRDQSMLNVWYNFHDNRKLQSIRNGSLLCCY